MLRSIVEVASDYGLNLDDPAIRAQCLEVFALGGPTKSDDGADTGLWATRLSFAGAEATELIAKIATRFGVTLSGTSAAKVVPVLGALTGAAVNASFTAYHRAMAHVHFRLLRLEQTHDPDEVQACFDRLRAQYRTAEAAGKAAAARDRRQDS